MTASEPPVHDDDSSSRRPLRGRDIFGTERELAEFVAHRTIIDQAKGMLMFVYGVDARHAFNLLRWRSQETNVKVRLLAQQLLEDLPQIADRGPEDMRSACDQALLTAHERVGRSTPPSV